jgi:hypothetical protein
MRASLDACAMVAVPAIFAGQAHHSGDSPAH